MRHTSLLLTVLLSLVSVPSGTSIARADMVVPEPVALDIAGSVSGSTLTYRITNPGTEALSLAQPHLVVLDRGVRLPLRLTAVSLDGAPRAISEPFTLAAGQTVTLTLTVESVRHGELELSFYRGLVRPHRMAV
jgi:hypothetical protein